MFGIDDDVILKNARHAYFRTGGSRADIPSGDGDIEYVGKEPYVVLSNGGGLLACYRVLPSGHIRRAAEVPEAILKKFGP
jgi:hypothetical protein